MHCYCVHVCMRFLVVVVVVGEQSIFSPHQRIVNLNSRVSFQNYPLAVYV